MADQPTPLSERVPLFDLGDVYMTPGAIVALEFNGVSPIMLLHRHVTADFGDLDGEDQRLNMRAIAEGTRILSAYKLADEQKVWIITEADRASTTILCPDEY